MAKKSGKPDAAKGGKGPRRTPMSAQMRREEIVALAVQLVSNDVIAKALGLHRSTVSKIVNEPEVRARIERQKATALDDARANMRKRALRASERMGDHIESRNQMVSLRACIESLASAGVDAPKKFDLKVFSELSDEELWEKLRELERRTGHESKKGEGPKAA